MGRCRSHQRSCIGIDKLVLEAQTVLDDLWASKLIPFQLTAQKVESIGSGEYIVRFRDSRLRSLDISWKDNESFKDAVQIAVLARMARLSGALRNWRKNLCFTMAVLEAFG